MRINRIFNSISCTTQIFVRYVEQVNMACSDRRYDVDTGMKKLRIDAPLYEVM